MQRLALQNGRFPKSRKEVCSHEDEKFFELIEKIASHDIESIQTIIKTNQDILKKKSTGRELVVYAAGLIDAGGISDENFNALHFAVMFGSKEIIRILLNEESDLLHQKSGLANQGITPLELAEALTEQMGKDDGIHKFLVALQQEKMHQEMPQQEGFTQKLGEMQFTQRQIEKIIKLKNGNTIRKYIKKRGNLNEAILELYHNCRSADNNSFLHFVIEKISVDKKYSSEWLQYAMILVNSEKLDVNAVNEFGETALHYAIDFLDADNDEHKKLVECLIKKGANPNQENNEHESPKDYAQNGTKKKWLNLLGESQDETHKALSQPQAAPEERHDESTQEEEVYLGDADDLGGGVGIPRSPKEETTSFSETTTSSTPTQKSRTAFKPVPHESRKFQQQNQSNNKVASSKANITPVISKETYQLIEEYLNQIKKYGMEELVRNGKMGNRLYTVLSTSHIQKLTTVEFIDALLKTNNPVVFSESAFEVKADGTDWTKEEISLLGRIGRVVKDVTVYSKNTFYPTDSDILQESERPKVTLLYANGALLSASQADLPRVVDENGDFTKKKIYKFLEDNFLPQLLFANVDAEHGGVVTAPVLGGKAFAGKYRQKIEECYADQVEALIYNHREQLGHIKGVVITGLDESKKNIKGTNIKLYTTRKAVGLYPREIDGSFAQYKTYAFVAGDPLSFPGNDSIEGSSLTHEGGVSAVTNVNEKVSEEKGHFDTKANESGMRNIFRPNPNDEIQDIEIEAQGLTYHDVYKHTQRTLTFNQVEVYDHAKGKREVLKFDRSENYSPQYLGVTNHNQAGAFIKQTAVTQEKKRTVALLDVDILMSGSKPNDALIQSLLKQDLKDIYLFTTDTTFEGKKLDARVELITYLKSKGLIVHGLISPRDLEVAAAQHPSSRNPLIISEFGGMSPIGAVFEKIKQTKKRDDIESLFQEARAKDYAREMQSLLSNYKPEWVRDGFIVIGKQGNAEALQHKKGELVGYNALIENRRLC